MVTGIQLWHAAKSSSTTTWPTDLEHRRTAQTVAQGVGEVGAQPSEHGVTAWWRVKPELSVADGDERTQPPLGDGCACSTARRLVEDGLPQVGYAEAQAGRR